MIYKQLEDLIGNTPIYKIKNLVDENSASIYVKLEGFNLGGSIKDRVALGMIQDAERNKQLRPGMRIIEPTSGNTGIAIALLGQLKGYPVTIVMPDSMSVERRQLIKSYGAELLLTPASEGMNGSIKAAELLAQDSNSIMLQQFKNPSNPDIHYQTTALEIVRELPDIDVFVAGIGTGGTITGVGKRLKEFNPKIQIIGLEPEESAILSGNPKGPHGIQGIGAGFVPDILNLDVIDEIITLKSAEVIKYGKLIYKQEGLFLGISSMANILAAVVLSRQLGPDKKILTIAPDSGEKYLSTQLYMEEKND